MVALRMVTSTQDHFVQRAEKTSFASLVIWCLRNRTASSACASAPLCCDSRRPSGAACASGSGAALIRRRLRPRESTYESRPSRESRPLPAPLAGSCGAACLAAGATLPLVVAAAADLGRVRLRGSDSSRCCRLQHNI